MRRDNADSAESFVEMGRGRLKTPEDQDAGLEAESRCVRATKGAVVSATKLATGSRGAEAQTTEHSAHSDVTMPIGVLFVNTRTGRLDCGKDRLTHKLPLIRNVV